MTIEMATNGITCYYKSMEHSRSSVLVRERSRVRSAAAAPAPSMGCTSNQAKIDSAPSVHRNSEAALAAYTREEWRALHPHWETSQSGRARRERIRALAAASKVRRKSTGEIVPFTESDGVNEFVDVDDLEVCPSTIYFAHDPDARLIKIGITHDLATRMRKLRTGSGRPLVLLSAIEGTHADEAAWHTRFKAFRLTGEWFTAAPVVLSAIAELGIARPLHRPLRQKLTSTEVKVIKRRLSAGDSNANIARDYGVTRQLISAIRRGRAWKEVA